MSNGSIGHRPRAVKSVACEMSALETSDNAHKSVELRPLADGRFEVRIDAAWSSGLQDPDESTTTLVTLWGHVVLCRGCGGDLMVLRHPDMSVSLTCLGIHGATGACSSKAVAAGIDLNSREWQGWFPRHG